MLSSFCDLRLFRNSVDSFRVRRHRFTKRADAQESLATSQGSKKPRGSAEIIFTTQRRPSLSERSELWDCDARLIRIRALDPARSYGRHYVVVRGALTGLNCRVGVFRSGD